MTKKYLKKILSSRLWAAHGPVSQMARVLFGVVSSILTRATTAAWLTAGLPPSMAAGKTARRCFPGTGGDTERQVGRCDFTFQTSEGRSSRSRSKLRTYGSRKDGTRRLVAEIGGHGAPGRGMDFASFSIGRPFESASLHQPGKAYYIKIFCKRRW